MTTHNFFSRKTAIKVSVILSGFLLLLLIVFFVKKKRATTRKAISVIALSTSKTSDSALFDSSRTAACKRLDSLQRALMLEEQIVLDKMGDSDDVDKIVLGPKPYNGTVDITGDTLDPELEYRRQQFSSAFYITNSYLPNSVDFFESEFLKGACFNWSRFNGKIDFNYAKFYDEASFRGIVLSDSAELSFDGALLPDKIDFSYNPKISNEIDLTSADFTDSSRYDSKKDEYFKPHLINLYKSDISKFRIDYTHFRAVTDSVDDMRGRQKISMDEAECIYEALLNNFKVHGQLESYKLLDIEYQKYKYQHSKYPFMVIFPEQWWNFGYNKEYVFKWTFRFLLFFTCFSFFILPYLYEVYCLEKVQNITLSKKIKQFSFKDYFIRFWFALVYSASIFFGLTLKIERIEYKKFWGTIYIVSMYTIGIICLAYMANYVLQK